MKVSFLKREEGNNSLILIFTGWSASASLYDDVSVPGWDVIVVSDYDDGEFDNSLLSRYSTIYLYAWSLGVAMAGVCLDSDKIIRKFAVNGTMKPSDDVYGILRNTYHSTAENLDDRNLRKFRRRMFESADSYKSVAHLLETEADIETLRNQLYTVDKITSGITPDFKWTRAYISEKDAIFPVRSQRRYWISQGNVEIFSLKGGHFIDLKKIILSTIPNPERVGKRFLKALPTYNKHAVAQRNIAQVLTSKLQSYLKSRKISSILEIGHGSGIFSRLYADLLKPEHITYIDLYPTEKLSLAPDEEYVAADAEKWLRHTDSKYDAIVSASAIQWFADIKNFIKHAASHLNPDGILVISTFGKGNLEELDEIRKSPIVYVSEDEWREWLSGYFTDVEITFETIMVVFDNARQVLLHLRNTGVGGYGLGVDSEGRRGLILPEFNAIDSLTYHPLYIIARKK